MNTSRIKSMMLSSDFEWRNAAYLAIEARHFELTRKQKEDLLRLVSGLMLNQLFDDERDELALLEKTKIILAEA